MTGAPVRSFARDNQELAEAFDRYLLARGLAAATRRSYHDSVGRFVDQLGSKSLAEGDRNDIRALQTALIAKGLSDSSLHTHVAALRCLYKFLKLAGVTKLDPTLLLAHRKRKRRIPRVLSVVEVEQLIAAGKNPFERALIEVFYATGMRLSEVCDMRLEDVDFSNRVMRVKRGKGDKDRIVLFGTKCAQALREYLGERKTGFLFQNRSGLKYCDRMLHVVVKRVGGRAGIRVHPHALRRAFASHLLQNGMNLRVIQELMGHSLISTTQLYTGLSAADLKKTHDQFHPDNEVRDAEEE